MKNTEKKHENLSLNNSQKKDPKYLKRYGLTAFKENIFLIKTGEIMLQVHEQEKPEIQQEKSIKSHKRESSLHLEQIIQ